MSQVSTRPTMWVIKLYGAMTHNHCQTNTQQSDQTKTNKGESISCMERWRINAAVQVSWDNLDGAMTQKTLPNKCSLKWQDGEQQWYGAMSHKRCHTSIQRRGTTNNDDESINCMGRCVESLPCKNSTKCSKIFVYNHHGDARTFGLLKRVVSSTNSNKTNMPKATIIY